MAHRNVEEIRRVQPRGPYYLGGFCFGGNLAFQIAIDLVEKGERVAFLGLFESYSPLYQRPPLLTLFRVHLHTMRKLAPAARWLFFKSKLANLKNRASKRVMRLPSPPPAKLSNLAAENAGFYIIPPKYLQPGNDDARGQFEGQCYHNFINYRSIITGQIGDYERVHGCRPRGIDYKRILEAGSGSLIHSVETSFIWTTNPAALAKLLKERDNEAADLEFQRAARKWKRVVMAHCPNAFPQAWMRQGL